MDILELELQGYRRFPFIKEDKLHLIFPSEKKLTLITGINGSGKSSLLSELTPYPASKSDLHKNGYKKITIQHQDRIYTLANALTDKDSSYSFIVDDVELNTSGLLTMQKSLIESHFGVSQEMFDILLGKVNFTNLNKQQRKKLINQITDIDVDVLIQKYEAVKEDIKLRELEIKQLRQRIIIEEAKLIDSERKASLDEEHRKILEHIDRLLEMRDHLTIYRVSDKIDDQVYLSFMDKYDTFMRRHKTILESYTKSEVRYKIEENMKLLSSLQTKIEHVYAKLEELHQLKKKIDAIKNSSKETLEQDLKQAELELKHLDEFFTTAKIIDRSMIEQPDTEVKLHQIYYPIKELLDLLPENQDKTVYNKDRYEKTEEELKLLVDKKHQIDIQLEAYRRDLLYLDKKSCEGHTVCPKCQHSWIPEYDEKKHIDLKSLIARLEKEHETLSASIQHLEQYIKEYKEYVAIFSRYRALLQHHPVIKNFFLELEERGVIFNQPRQAPALYSETIERELMILRNYKETVIKKRSIEDDLLKIHETGEVDKSSIDLKIITQEDILMLYRYEKKMTEEQLQELRMVEEILERYEKVQSRKKEIIEHKKRSNLNKLVEEYISILDQELRSSKLRLSEIETLLRDHQYVLNIVESCKSDLEKKERELKLVQLIEKEFNPKTGLISQVISHFINSILRSMNSIISSIWSYDMQIVPYDLENDALDYSFKVRVEDKLDISDISMVSSGMKEIINLAFKLTIMKLLKLEHFPLYIDEYGVNLDKEHRAKIHHLIMRLIKSEEYSRVFLINHEDDVGFSALNDTHEVKMS